MILYLSFYKTTSSSENTSFAFGSLSNCCMFLCYSLSDIGDCNGDCKYLARNLTLPDGLAFYRCELTVLLSRNVDSRYGVVVGDWVLVIKS